MLIKKLKQLRKEAGLTQKMVAQILNVSCSTYTKYELGENEPDIETIIKLSKIFQVSVDYLLDVDVDNQNSSSFMDVNYLHLQKIILLYPDADLLICENGLTDKGWNRLENSVKKDIKIKNMYTED